MLEANISRDLFKRSCRFYAIMSAVMTQIAIWAWYMGVGMMHSSPAWKMVLHSLIIVAIFGGIAYATAPYVLKRAGETYKGKIANAIVVGSCTFIIAALLFRTFPIFGLDVLFTRQWLYIWPLFLFSQGVMLYLSEQRHSLGLLAVIDRQSQFRNLQTRIYPHFLFNALNNIAALLDANRDQAEGALLDLADVMRASISTPDTLVALEDEAAMALKYAAVEKLRWQDMHVEADIPKDCEQILVPTLIVQPLIENAVYHGVSKRHDGGVVTVKARMTGDWIHIEVSNPIADLKSKQHKGNGFALASVSKRLEFIYEESTFESKEEDGLYIATIGFNTKTYTRIIDEEPPQAFKGIAQKLSKN